METKQLDSPFLCGISSKSNCTFCTADPYHLVILRFWCTKVGSNRLHHYLVRVLEIKQLDCPFLCGSQSHKVQWPILHSWSSSTWYPEILMYTFVAKVGSNRLHHDLVSVLEIEHCTHHTWALSLKDQPLLLYSAKQHHLCHYQHFLVSDWFSPITSWANVF